MVLELLAMKALGQTLKRGAKLGTVAPEVACSGSSGDSSAPTATLSPPLAPLIHAGLVGLAPLRLPSTSPTFTRSQ